MLSSFIILFLFFFFFSETPLHASFIKKRVPKEWLTQINYMRTHSAGYMTTEKVANNLDFKQTRKKGGRGDPSTTTYPTGPATKIHQRKIASKKDETAVAKHPQEEPRPRRQSIRQRQGSITPSSGMRGGAQSDQGVITPSTAA
jgi:hypothetical protein